MEILSLFTNEINQNGYNFNLLTKNKIGFLYIAPVNIVPEDCLACDGYVLRIEDYRKLYSVIGKKFNTGEESSEEFRIPDYNITKRFLQPGEDVGEYIEAGLPQHNHSGTTSSNGAHTHKVSYTGSNYDDGDPGSLIITAAGGSNGTRTLTAASAGAHTHTMTTGNASNGIYGKSTTVQPPSQIVHICIKYK